MVWIIKLSPGRTHTVCMVLSVLLILVIITALCVGAVPIAIKDMVTLLMYKVCQLFGLRDRGSVVLDNHLQLELIVFHLRLPRVCLAICVGALLAVSGAITQGLFRNPLADPSLIGVSAGASLGASIGIVLGSYIGVGVGSFSVSGLSIVSLSACIGALLAVLLVYVITTAASRKGGLSAYDSGLSVTTMLLVGMGITAFAGGMTNLLEFIADNSMLRRISLWQMGGLDGANWYQVSVAMLLCGVMLWFVPRYGVALNAMLLGESEARALGVRVHHVKQLLVVWVAVAVGCAVTLAGMIAFVGLIVPHIMRSIVGPNHIMLLPSSALAGALLLLLADTCARTVLSPIEIPVGLITTLVGAPLFLLLLAKGRAHRSL